jgi:AcrR family transcriptional regulator
MTRHPHARGPGAAHEQQRRNIIEAVFTVVDEAGTGQATVRNVAKAAGVSPGRVQHYFKTKDALLEAAFTAVTEAGTENIRRRLAESGSDGEEAIVATTLTELIPVDEDHRRLVRVSQAFEVYAMSRPELRERLHDDYDRLIA